MKISSKILIACLTCLFLSACGSSQDLTLEGAKGDQSGSKAKVVLVTIDQATIDWAERTPSLLDSLPIDAPKSDKRFREVYGRLVQKLAELPTPPVTTTWDFYFPADDGAATSYLADSLDNAPFQVVLGNQGEGLDPAVHSSDRRQGHLKLIWDLELEEEPVKGRMGVPLEDFLDVQLQGADPLSVAGSIETLSRWCEMDTAAAEELARARAREMSETYDTSYGRKYGLFGAWEVTESISAIPLAEREVVQISAAELLDGEISAENQAKLAGAAVVVGATWAGFGDVQDLLSTGTMLPGVMAHVWTMSAILAQGC